MVLDGHILRFKFELAFRLRRMECILVTYRALSDSMYKYRAPDDE